MLMLWAMARLQKDNDLRGRQLPIECVPTLDRKSNVMVSRNQEGRGGRTLYTCYSAMYQHSHFPASASGFLEIHCTESI